MRKSSLLVIFLIVFIDLVGFGIVIPILPYYAQSFGASAWELGWLMAIYSLAQFVMAPIWGRFSDSVGRRPVLLLSLVGTILSMTILGLAQSLLWLFLGRLFAGISTANISTAYAYVADTTDESNRAKGMGIVGAGFGLGFIFGPAIGGVLSRFGYGAPMFAGAGLAALNLCFAWFKLRETALSREARTANRPKRFSLENLQVATRSRLSTLAIGTFFLLTFAVTQMEVTFAIFMRALYGYNAQQAGYILAMMGVIMATMQGRFIGPLAKRFGEKRLILFGSALCAVALAWFGSLSVAGWAVTALAFVGLGHGLLHPSLSSLASLGAPPSSRGATMGVFHSASSLARVLGPPIAGWLYDHAGMRSPFFLGSAVLVAVFLVVSMSSSADSRKVLA